MNATKCALVETAALVGESAASDGTWKVRIINAGRGSSGIYSEQLLETHAKAFSNALSFKNHPVNYDGPETRDFTMIAGKIVGESWSERDSSGQLGIYGNFLPDPEYAEKLERYRDNLGLSIYIEGSGEFNEGNGDFEILWLNEQDPYKSVDVVIAPGRGGKLAVESLRRMYAVTETPEPSKVEQESRKETENMDEVLKALEALATKFDTFISAQEAHASAQEQAVEVDEAVSSAVEAYDAAVESINAADLLPSQAKAIRAAVKEGADAAPLIEQALEVRKELEESLVEQDAGTSGYIREAGKSSETYTLRGFGGTK